MMLLALVSAMVFSSAFHAVPAKAQTSSVTGEIVNPLVGTNDFAFNSSVYPVNSTFTVDFYVSDVTDMAAWQIYISWNNTMINFDTLWIPGVNSSGTNVFTEAFNNGAEPIPAGPYVDVDPTTNTASLFYGLANVYKPPKDPVYAVNVEGLGLLCSMNFTIQVNATESNILSGTISNLDASLGLGAYSEVVDPSGARTEILAQPATLEIYGPEATIPEFTPWMIMPFFIVATLLVALAYQSQRKNRRPK
jgi:hypothetical protein